MQTKCIIFDEALRTRVKKVRQNLPENYSKGTKIAITVCKFLKIFPGEDAPGPPELFLFLNQLSICSAKTIMPKKKVEIMPPSFLNFSLRHWSISFD